MLRPAALWERGPRHFSERANYFLPFFAPFFAVVFFAAVFFLVVFFFAAGIDPSLGIVGTAMDKILKIQIVHRQEFTRGIFSIDF